MMNTKTGNIDRYSSQSRPALPNVIDSIPQAERISIDLVILLRDVDRIKGISITEAHERYYDQLRELAKSTAESQKNPQTLSVISVTNSAISNLQKKALEMVKERQGPEAQVFVTIHNALVAISKTVPEQGAKNEEELRYNPRFSEIWRDIYVYSQALTIKTAKETAQYVHQQIPNTRVKEEMQQHMEAIKINEAMHGTYEPSDMGKLAPHLRHDLGFA